MNTGKHKNIPSIVVSVVLTLTLIENLESVVAQWRCLSPTKI